MCRVSQGVLGPGALVPGTKYRVVRQLGEGGMGVVYQVQKPPQIPGVLKLMTRQLAAHEEYRQRFLDEVRVLAQLEHPNIVRVFDYDALPDGTPFYVMELLTGRTVREALATMRRLPPRVAFEITRQLLEALHAAHTHDVPVVHRDIKPENIFLHSPRHGDPIVKLIDFGVVAFMDRQPEGAFVGTWSYAAPEQIRGEAATPKTDLYAVGCVLYEMLAGVGPFDHLEDKMPMGQAQLEVEPPLVTTIAPWVPKSIEQLVHSALAKDPALRPKDAYSFSERLFELEWVSDGSDPGDATREGPLSRVLTTLSGGAPSAQPAHSPMAPGVVRLPESVHVHGPTIPGVGGPHDSTSPGEETLLDGLDARSPGAAPRRRSRESNRDLADAMRVVVTPAGADRVRIDGSPRPPTAITEDEPDKRVDTFATQETTTTPRARAAGGERTRWPLFVAGAAVLLLGAGAVAALRAGATGTGNAATSMPPPEQHPTATHAPAPPATSAEIAPPPPPVASTAAKAESAPTTSGVSKTPTPKATAPTTTAKPAASPAPVVASAPPAVTTPVTSAKATTTTTAASTAKPAASTGMIRDFP